MKPNMILRVISESLCIKYYHYKGHITISNIHFPTHPFYKRSIFIFA